MNQIRRCRDDDYATILGIINVAAEAYRGVIPSDCWHEPYMPASDLAEEVKAGVVFWVYEREGQLLGAMGFQPAGNVDLIRHAYVVPGNQRNGIGGALLTHMRRLSKRRVLVGTWGAAEWAIRFYERHDFVLVSPALKVALLRTHWTVSDRQIETSVVLANPPLNSDAQ